MVHAPGRLAEQEVLLAADFVRSTVVIWGHEVGVMHGGQGAQASGLDQRPPLSLAAGNTVAP